jgi:hypothetical protein
VIREFQRIMQRAEAARRDAEAAEAARKAAAARQHR